MRHVHFVGFTDNRYLNAIKVFGIPDFIHIGWDLRAQCNIDDGDLVIFAQGEYDQTPRIKPYPDIIAEYV